MTEFTTLSDIAKVAIANPKKSIMDCVKEASAKKSTEKSSEESIFNATLMDIAKVAIANPKKSIMDCIREASSQNSSKETSGESIFNSD